MSVLTGDNPFQNHLDNDILFKKDKQTMTSFLDKFDHISEDKSSYEIKKLYKEWESLDEEFLKDLEQWKKDGSI